MAKMRKNPVQNKSAAKSTVSGTRRGPREANNNGAAARLRKTQALAAAFPFIRQSPQLGLRLGSAPRVTDASRAGADCRPPAREARSDP